jgi:hypothetical protein
MILKVPRAVDARRGISLSTNAGIPQPPATREEWQDEDSERPDIVTDLHRRIGTKSDTHPRIDADDESRLSNLNPHSMLLMHEV